MRACFALLLALAVPGMALAQQEPSPQGSPPGTAEAEAPPVATGEGTDEDEAEPSVAEPVAEGPAPAVVPPVLVLPFWNARIPAPAAAAIRDAVAEQLRALVGRRDVQMIGDEAALGALRACADAPCIGAIIAEAGAIAGVSVRMERQRSRDPIRVTLAVVDPVSGAPRGESIEGEVPRDQAATPMDSLAALTSQLAALMPAPPRSTTLLIAANVDGATVRIDQEEVGETPLAPRTINPGDHTVVLTRAGYLLQSQRVGITQGQLARVNFDLVPTAEQAAAEALAGGTAGSVGAGAGAEEGAGTDASAEDEGGLLTKWWLWAGVGGVVVLAVLIGVIAAATSGESQQEAVTVPPIMP